MTDHSRRTALAASAIRADAAAYDTRPMDGAGPRDPGEQAPNRNEVASSQTGRGNLGTLKVSLSWLMADPRHETRRNPLQSGAGEDIS